MEDAVMSGYQEFAGEDSWTDGEGAVWQIRPSNSPWRRAKLQQLLLDPSVGVLLRDTRPRVVSTRAVLASERKALWPVVEASMFRDPDEPLAPADYDFFYVDEYRERETRRSMLYIEETCS